MGTFEGSFDQPWEFCSDPESDNERLSEAFAARIVFEATRTKTALDEAKAASENLTDEEQELVVEMIDSIFN